MTEQDVFNMAREVCGKWPSFMSNPNLQAFAKLIADKEREACAERAWIALVTHKQPWNVRQDVTEAIRLKDKT